MTAAFLLPVVAPIVSSATGSIVAGVLPKPTYVLWTAVVSYILWGAGVPLAMAILVIYFQRLTVHKLPPREVIVSVFLPLGPLGQGGFAIMQLGKVALEAFPKTHTLEAAAGSAGQILYVFGWLTALIMWGFAVVWLLLALGKFNIVNNQGNSGQSEPSRLTTTQYIPSSRASYSADYFTASISRSKFPFNMGWWGFTFPLGVLTVATTTIGEEMPSKFFLVLGTVSSRDIYSRQLLISIFWCLPS